MMRRSQYKRYLNCGCPIHGMRCGYMDDRGNATRKIHRRIVRARMKRELRKRIRREGAEP